MVAIITHCNPAQDFITGSKDCEAQLASLSSNALLTCFQARVKEFQYASLLGKRLNESSRLPTKDLQDMLIARGIDPTLEERRKLSTRICQFRKWVKLCDGLGVGVLALLPLHSDGPSFGTPSSYHTLSEDEILVFHETLHKEEVLTKKMCAIGKTVYESVARPPSAFQVDPTTHWPDTVPVIEKQVDGQNRSVVNFDAFNIHTGP